MFSKMCNRGSTTLYDASPLIWLILALAALAAIFLLGGYKEVVSSWTIAQYGEGPTVTISRAELEKMFKAQAERAWVYYPDAAMQPVAEQIAAALSRAYALIPERLGLEPKPMGLVLIGGERPGMIKVEELEVESEIVFPQWLPAEVIASGLEQADKETLRAVYWTMPHEVTEGAISPRLYRNDCATRWVGDGLADYAGYVVSGQFSPAAQQLTLERRLKSIERLLAQGKKSYNLPEEFQAARHGQILVFRWGCRKSPFEIMVAGYAVSLALWLDLVHRHGEEIIKQFWQRLQQIPRPTNRDVIKILRELTGEDLGTAITEVDLQRAAEVLQRHLFLTLESLARYRP